LLENIIEEQGFAQIMKKSIEEIIIHFFEIEQNFGILCKIEEVEFNPELRDTIKSECSSLTLFFLAGYTFDTARIKDACLDFEAGLGGENIGSVLTVAIRSIMEIIVDETQNFINLCGLKEQD